MIVRTAGPVLHLITQPDHAALAGRVMRDWVPLHDATRRDSILLAIDEHDNGWREPDGAPTVDIASGRVHDFVNAPASVRQAVWPRGVGRLAHAPWAAALVAHHAITVYDRYAADAAWRAFFANLEVIRNEHVQRIGLTLSELEDDYQMLRIGDLISLTFCNLWDEQSYQSWTFRRADQHIVVTPDPFAGREVPLSVTACEIPNQAYASDDELRDALRRAPAVTLRGACLGKTSE
jgi:hypothetical protein